MMDNSFFMICVLERDFEQVEHILGEADEASTLDDGTVNLLFYQAARGFSGKRDILAQENIPFYGTHGPGISYGPAIFAGAHTEHVSVPCDHENKAPVVRVSAGSENGRLIVWGDDQVAACEYFRVLAAAEKQLNATEARAATGLALWLGYTLLEHEL